jgi:adenosine 3'-phospho 5'-phosphosulfate transporter B2
MIFNSKIKFLFLGPQPVGGCINLLIRLFISDTNPPTSTDSTTNEVTSSSSGFTQFRFFKLVFSFFGLQISYLLWGLLQERIMTRTYADEKFSNSQFLVFVNRFLAMFIAYLSLKIFYPMKKLMSTGPPLFQYGIISYANCMSTWFQYESLLYISFPVQVIAKSVKTIPVMIVGKFVSGKTYPFRQYLLMLIMAGGIALFLSGYQESGTVKLTSKRAKHNITTLNGVILLIFYLVSPCILFKGNLCLFF